VGFFYEATMPFIERQRKIWNMGKSLVEKFIDDRCMTMASALSFSSMLSFVPFLAIVFAILKALDIHTTLAPMLLSNLAAGSQEIAPRILRYIDNTRVGSLGVVGLITLFLTVIATLDTIEDAFNQICGIAPGKAVHHKLRDYLIVIFSIPLLIGLAVTIITSLQHQSVVRWLLQLPGISHLLLLRLIPYLSIWIALVCLYQFIPNVQIRFRNALTGGLVTCTSLQLTQWAFIHFQLGVTRQNAIYGTLALLPVFMVWIYTCWIIILAGMQIVWHLHNKTTVEIPPGIGPDGDISSQSPAQHGFPRD
jgi:membrane protein